MEDHIRTNWPDFYMDSSRREFLLDAERTLVDLTGDRLRGMTSFRRLLLGRKGVGKTSLFRVLSKVAVDVYKATAVLIDYTNAPKARMPLDVVWSSLGGRSDEAPVDVAHLDAYLRRTKRFLLLVVDELDTVFTGACPIGKEIVGELMEIGSSAEGRIHCILSGSSSRLRQLCFAKLPIEDWPMFPNYTSSDMNSTKYSARWIFPFLDRNDFINAAAVRGFDVRDEEHFVEAYMETGGNMRLMEDFFRNGQTDSYSITLRRAADAEKTLLRAVYSCVTDFQPVEADIPALYWTMYIPLATVRNYLREMDNELDVSVLYNLADKGHLRYDDRINTHREPMISLGSSLLYLELAQSDVAELTTREATALLYPHGNNHSLGEQVAFRFLARRSIEWLGVKCNSYEIQELNIHGQGPGRVISGVPYQVLVGRLWKEIPDAYGADAVLFEPSSDTFPNHLGARRIQLKLGKSLITVDEARKIVHRFLSMREAFDAALFVASYTIVEHVYYVVTTRPVHPEAEAFFQTHPLKIHMIGQRFLQEKVWPIVVQRLGKPYA